MVFFFLSLGFFSDEGWHSEKKQWQEQKLSLTLHLQLGFGQNVLLLLLLLLLSHVLCYVIPGIYSLVSCHGSLGKLGMADARRLSLTFLASSCFRHKECSMIFSRILCSIYFTRRKRDILPSAITMSLTIGYIMA